MRNSLFIRYIEFFTMRTVSPKILISFLFRILIEIFIFVNTNCKTAHFFDKNVSFYPFDNEK